MPSSSPGGIVHLTLRASQIASCALRIAGRKIVEIEPNSCCFLPPSRQRETETGDDRLIFHGADKARKSLDAPDLSMRHPAAPTGKDKFSAPSRPATFLPKQPNLFVLATPTGLRCVSVRCPLEHNFTYRRNCFFPFPHFLSLFRRFQSRTHKSAAKMLAAALSL